MALVAAIISACSSTSAAEIIASSHTWSEASLRVQVRLGDHYMARCYDQGGESSWSWVILFGSGRSQDYGERCDTFALVSIEAHANDVRVPECFWDECPQRTLPVSYIPAHLPVEGKVLVLIPEAISLFRPGSLVDGWLVAGQTVKWWGGGIDGQGWNNQTWESFKPISLVGYKQP